MLFQDYRKMYTVKKAGFTALVFCFYSINPACSREAGADSPALLYDSIPVIKPVVPIINECSGIADSQRNPGMLWVEEDSGNPSQLHLLSYEGQLVKRVFIKGAINRDWEDICLVDGKIYVGDIGDNTKAKTECIIYRFDEPPAYTDTIHVVDAIRFNYADGPRDAEAFLVDAATGDIFIITKNDNPSRIYKLGFPYPTTTLNMAIQVGALTYSGVVSAAISQDGKEILLKTYKGLQYFKRGTNQSIPEALNNKYDALPYIQEPQGEAVCFAISGSGFFTLSEKGFSSMVNLYYYPKK
jgi:hypothetical protein